MTEKEAIELFEKVHFVHEQLDMERDIHDIDHMLSRTSIDIYQVREKIDIVNIKHPENVILFRSIFPPQGASVSLKEASLQNLISDLTWKRSYLWAKRAGKTFDELCKEMQK